MDVFDYLTKLPPAALDRLYSRKHTTAAVFRSLPTLSQQIVLRSWFVPEVPLASVLSWGRPESQTELKQHLMRLRDLRICLVQNKMAQLQTIMVNPKFSSNLQELLLQVQADASPVVNAPDAKQLSEYAETKWNSILYFMANLEGSDQPSDTVVQLLVDTDLMSPGEGGYVITSSGFRFLLKDIHSQVWTFCMQYVETAEKRNMDTVEVLSFIFRLSLLTIGKGYAISELNEGERDLLNDLFDFGVVYISPGTGAFYPTRLAGALASKGKRAFGEGFLLVETNFRVYAYIQNPLHVALLSLFAQLLYRLPDMAVGVITRESVSLAFANGITSDLILEFIEHHSHPEMVSKVGSRGPPTVIDQLRIWESERDRVKYQNAVLFDAFPSASVFTKVREFAEDCGYHLFSDTQQRILVVNDQGDSVERIKQYLQKCLLG